MKKPFGTLAIRYDNGCETHVFSVGDDPGKGIDPYDDAIKWTEFLVYGVPDGENVQERIWEDDFTLATQIGKVFGCHIPKSLIVNLDGDPYDVCDCVDGDLEAMYSVFQEYEDLEDFEDLVFVDNIYYIHEIEMNAGYQGFGYEAIILQQLPAIIVKALRIFPFLLMYFPALAKSRETEIDKEEEDILRHRLEYALKDVLKDENKIDSNVALFPPKREVPEKAINRHLGRRNPGDIVPKENRNPDQYKLYQSVGFKEFGKTGWLYKYIVNIFTKDGLNPRKTI